MSDEAKTPVEGELSVPVEPEAVQEKTPVQGEADPNASGSPSFSIVRLTEDQCFATLGYEVKDGRFTGRQVEVKTTEPHDLAVAYLTAMEGVLKIKRTMNEGSEAFAKKLVEDAMAKQEAANDGGEAAPEEKPPEPEVQSA